MNHLKLKLPDGPFGAYLFDCDGTIVDSMPLHYIAWKTVLAEWNCTFEEQLFYSWGGTPTAEIVSLLNQRQGLNMPIEGGAAAKATYPFTPLHDGDTLEFGRVRLKVLETPGHTPESISILVYDLNGEQSGK